ncbi:FAD:protein FMN transferase [Modicisalibacter xianhensis]|uniref:FAD:protein FMN transferase n=1 Tax=Modicisalibacter xianhensis TaxID=442341 RepID=A0A1I3BW79_9GAMM|nr:FAD:protein FMN transferase [Halomonas xianhensis]TDX30372.1 thiamine biosynthesis lipoprotein [Halomonas xianhensis]SFH66001.1 thiamine biosynthesis lipoprotein [Halomonas xianhensis]
MLLIACLLLLAGCDSSPQAHRFQGPVFGTGYHVTLYADLDEESYAEIDAGIQAELERVDALMSTYRDDSELSRLNRYPVGVPFFLSPPTAEVIGESLRIARLSNDAFDVTVGPAVNLWGFGPEGRPERVPDAAALADALSRVDVHALQLDGETLVKTKPVYVDLSGIAKGYATDQVADYLASWGVEDYLVEIGGEIRTHGEKPDGTPWRIAVEKPISSERSVQQIIDLGNAGVATSGDYRNYFESDGIRYSHTIDPRTGKPITNRVASVTVITERCMTADALATAFTVMGAEAGLALAERENIPVYFIVRSDDGFDTRMSPAFERYLEDSAQEGG